MNTSLKSAISHQLCMRLQVLRRKSTASMSGQQNKRRVEKAAKDLTQVLCRRVFLLSKSVTLSKQNLDCTTSPDAQEREV